MRYSYWEQKYVPNYAQEKGVKGVLLELYVVDDTDTITNVYVSPPPQKHLIVCRSKIGSTKYDLGHKAEL